MAEPVVIAHRFRGPPASGHGGYTCGLVAEHVAGDTAAVSLRLPPPLERPLAVERREDGTVALRAGDTLVAEGGPAELRLDVLEPPPLEQARAAAARSPWGEHHPFPGCFGCGPERSQDEAVAITAGPVPGRDLFAAPWTPLAEFAGDDGTVAARYVWAALDCPTAVPAVAVDTAPSVLARLTARLLAPVAPGVEHVVTAWLVGHDGRKHVGAAAIHAPDGTLCACSEGLWIELRDPAALGARSRA